jgi:hypothetical protein
MVLELARRDFLVRRLMDSGHSSAPREGSGAACGRRHRRASAFRAKERAQHKVTALANTGEACSHWMRYAGLATVPVPAAPIRPPRRTCYRSTLVRRDLEAGASARRVYEKKPRSRGAWGPKGGSRPRGRNGAQAFGGAVGELWADGDYSAFANRLRKDYSVFEVRPRSRRRSPSAPRRTLAVGRSAVRRGLPPGRHSKALSTPHLEIAVLSLKAGKTGSKRSFTGVRAPFSQLVLPCFTCARGLRWVLLGPLGLGAFGL